MGNVSSLSQWDTLFQALTTPEDLRAYLDRHAQPDGDLHKTAHLLVGTLHVDISLLRLSEVAESFDTATFCLGQLVSHEPKIMSELPIAKTVVSGLSCVPRLSERRGEERRGGSCVSHARTRRPGSLSFRRSAAPPPRAALHRPAPRAGAPSPRGGTSPTG